MADDFCPDEGAGVAYLTVRQHNTIEQMPLRAGGSARQIVARAVEEAARRALQRGVRTPPQRLRPDGLALVVAVRCVPGRAWRAYRWGISWRCP